MEIDKLEAENLKALESLILHEKWRLSGQAPRSSGQEAK